MIRRVKSERGSRTQHRHGLDEEITPSSHTVEIKVQTQERYITAKLARDHRETGYAPEMELPEISHSDDKHTPNGDTLIRVDDSHVYFLSLPHVRIVLGVYTTSLPGLGTRLGTILGGFIHLHMEFTGLRPLNTCFEGSRNLRPLGAEVYIGAIEHHGCGRGY
jgi:hypothetical protein